MSNEDSWLTDQDAHAEFNPSKQQSANKDRQQHFRNDRSGRHEEILNIRSSDIGIIIGRGGSNIRRTQEDYKVSLNVDKQRNEVKISGNTENDVRFCIEYLKNQLDGRDGQSHGSQDHGSRRGRGNYQDNTDRAPRERYDYHGYNDYQEKQEQKNSYKKEYTEQNHFYTPEEDNISETIDWDAVNKISEIERAKRWAKCPQLTKNFYKEHQEVTSLTEEQARQIRLNNNNTTAARMFKDQADATNNSGKSIPNPIFKFEHCFEEYPDLLSEIQKQGFKDPSPIQAQAWPILLKGEDLIGIAQTGTGKTLAFLLPAMIHTEYQSIPRSERGGPNVLIMAPTRELALQIEKEVNKYSFRGMKAVCVYGGGNRDDQITHVQKGVEIIICTPGRLNDLIQANVIDVNTITYLVLDEADRMLDMGFEPQIRKILLDIRPDRQTVMTSATWPPGVRRLAQSYMDNPIQVCVGTLDLAATHTVTQVVKIMEDDEKYIRIKNFIRNMEHDDKVIIFCGRKTRADDLSSDLTLDGVMCQCIHGSRDQADREQAIDDISTGYVKILIATDVASRGLDIEDITHVINFDFPRNIEEYVHRVGRTGRAGRNGMSISFLTRDDWGMAQPLIDILKEADQEVPEELNQMADRFKAMKDRRANELEKIGPRSRGGSGGNRSFGRGGNRY